MQKPFKLNAATILEELNILISEGYEVVSMCNAGNYVIVVAEYLLEGC